MQSTPPKGKKRREFRIEMSSHEPVADDDKIIALINNWLARAIARQIADEWAKGSDEAPSEVSLDPTANKGNK